MFPRRGCTGSCRSAQRSNLRGLCKSGSYRGPNSETSRGAWITLYLEACIREKCFLPLYRKMKRFFRVKSKKPFNSHETRLNSARKHNFTWKKPRGPGCSPALPRQQSTAGKSSVPVSCPGTPGRASTPSPNHPTSVPRSCLLPCRTPDSRNSGGRLLVLAVLQDTQTAPCPNPSGDISSHPPTLPLGTQPAVRFAQPFRKLASRTPASPCQPEALGLKCDSR